MNVSKWIYNFRDLDHNNQLKVAEGIIQELEDNENFLDEEDGYNNERSILVRKTFEKMIAYETNEQNLRQLNQQIQAFENFSSANKRAFIDEVLRLIGKYSDIQDQEEKEAICDIEGHVFSKWNHHAWTTHEQVIIDHQYIDNYPVSHELWSRTCRRCGYQEKTEQEPSVLVSSRKRREKQEKIKTLEAELRRLKDGE